MYSDPIDLMKLFDWKYVSDFVVKIYYVQLGEVLNNITLYHVIYYTVLILNVYLI